MTTPTLTLDVFGFPMECEYEFDPGEPAIWSPIDRAHPGSPAIAVLLSCKVGGVNVYEMLDNEQIERIERAILNEVEFV